MLVGKLKWYPVDRLNVEPLQKRTWKKRMAGTGIDKSLRFDELAGSQTRYTYLDFKCYQDSALSYPHGFSAY